MHSSRLSLRSWAGISLCTSGDVTCRLSQIINELQTTNTGQRTFGTPEKLWRLSARLGRHFLWLHNILRLQSNKFRQLLAKWTSLNLERVEFELRIVFSLRKRNLFDYNRAANGILVYHQRETGNDPNKIISKSIIPTKKIKKPKPTYTRCSSTLL